MASSTCRNIVEHGFSDIRAFVLGDQVIASMRRVATCWKTNYSRGAHPAPTEISDEYKELAVKASKAVRCIVAGVDILEGPNGPCIVDVNSQPGWKGLQAVSKANIAEEIVQYMLNDLKK